MFPQFPGGVHDLQQQQRAQHAALSQEGRLQVHQQQQHGTEQQSEELLGGTGVASALLQEDGPGPATKAGDVAHQRPASQQGKRNACLYKLQIYEVYWDKVLSGDFVCKLGHLIWIQRSN